MGLELFQYSFMVRGLVLGLIAAVIAPLIGVFLVLKRYSLIADTLSHVSLAGIAIGLLFGLHPGLTALGTTVVTALGLERLRRSRIYSESALAIFLSGSLALAVVIFGLARGFNVNILNYLFGSILTVTTSDIYLIGALAIVIGVAMIIFFKELVAVTFDEEAAQVVGLPVRLINTVFIILAALTVAIAIPVVGVLLIAALVVIPAVTALQLRRNLVLTIIYAELFSVLAVASGILISFYLDLVAGGTIVLVMLAIFVFVSIFKPAIPGKEKEAGA